MIATSSPTTRLVRLKTHACAAAAKAPSTSPFIALTPTRMGVPNDYADRDRYYAEFAPLVRRLIRQYGQDADMREDLSGEIYCRFCALLEAFDPTRGIPLRPYIIRQLSMATYTYARQQWRIQKRETTWESGESQIEKASSFDPTGEWLATLDQEQAASRLPIAMQRLPTRQRCVVIWRYYEERSFEEIADMLAIQPASARSLLRHGLARLRHEIGIKD